MPSKRGLRALLGSGDRLLANPLPGVGAAVVVAGIVCTEYGMGELRHTRFKLTNFSLATVDHTTAGASGSQKLYDFPAGGVVIQATSARLTTARVGTGLAATAALTFGLGTAAAGAADGALTTTEQDILASTAGTLVAGAGTFAARGAAVALGITPDLYLNAAVVDAGTSGNDAILLNGDIDVWWIRTTLT